MLLKEIGVRFDIDKLDDYIAIFSLMQSNKPKKPKKSKKSKKSKKPKKVKDSDK